MLMWGFLVCILCLIRYSNLCAKYEYIFKQ